MKLAFSSGLGRIALLLCVCLLGNSLAFAAQKPMDAAGAKQKVQSHGIGKTVRITENDGSEVKGKVTTINADSFQVQPKSAAPVEISYANVKAVRGAGLSTGAKIGIGVAAGIGIAVIVIAIEYETHPIKIGPTL
jgi:hypothetical protein